MKSNMYALLIVMFCLVQDTSGQSLWLGCPIIESVPSFDLNQFISRTWFIQRQQPTLNQPANSLFCASATYVDESVRNYGRRAISVYNYANLYEVNGAIQGSNDGVSPQEPICAITPDRFQPSKLGVLPCSSFNILASPYWVTAFDENYEWAIIVGGQPNYPGLCDEGNARLCTTDEGFGGLWFLTRARIASPETLQTMEDVAAELGICTALMLHVEHEGCMYEGHILIEN